MAVQLAPIVVDERTVAVQDDERPGPSGPFLEDGLGFPDALARVRPEAAQLDIAYFKPLDAPLSQNTMMYVVAHPSRDAAKKAWAGVAADPEFQKVLAETDRNGTVVAKVESVFAAPADYSPLK